MERLQKYLFHPVAQNVLAWLVFLAIFFLIADISVENSEGGNEWVLIGMIFWSLVEFVVLVYLNYGLIYLLFDRGYFWYYGLALAGMIFTYAGVLHMIADSGNSYGERVSTYVFALMISTATLFIRRSIVQKRNQLRQDFLLQQMELKLLKAQVNPHFLFNSLNNIYALSLENMPETSETILRLSELLRYQLESASNPKVKLSEEILFIQNYIDLEKIRLHRRCDLQLVVEGQIHHQEIAPMLLIPFVENSFKHGVNTLEDSFVHIKIHCEEHDFNFCIENSIPPSKPSLLSTRTGLDNVKRRLNLLYKNKHDLDIKTKDHIFIVKLSLHLL